MKKLLMASVLSITTVGFSQTNCETLQSTNKVLSSENDYLKKILEINKPILETEQDYSTFKITKVIGNKSEKTIAITFLVEAKDENKEMTLSDISIIDIEGAEYQIDFYKSSSLYPKLASNVPLKLTFSFKNIQDEPLFIKLFRFKANSKSKKTDIFGINSNIELRDLKVLWK